MMRFFVLACLLISPLPAYATNDGKKVENVQECMDATDPSPSFTASSETAAGNACDHWSGAQSVLKEFLDGFFWKHTDFKYREMAYETIDISKEKALIKVSYERKFVGTSISTYLSRHWDSGSTVWSLLCKKSEGSNDSRWATPVFVWAGRAE